MEDFDSLNEKQLESLERGLSDLKHNRIITSNEFWKELLSKKEQQLLIDEAYENYCKSFENQTLIEQYSFDTDPMTQFMFINKCKENKYFSEKWGLKIEEREKLDIGHNVVNKQTLYSEIETLIIKWNIDGTKTAGSLTRDIMKLIENELNPNIKL